MTLDRLVKADEIEKVEPGVYVMKDTFIDELCLAQSMYSKGIACSKRTPGQICHSSPLYNKRNIRIRINRNRKLLWEQNHSL
jgi:hypothetical protein